MSGRVKLLWRISPGSLSLVRTVLTGSPSAPSGSTGERSEFPPAPSANEPNAETLSSPSAASPEGSALP